MSVETDPVPPVPEHTPPLKEDEHNPQIGKYFNHVWTRWFVSLREKINVLNESLVNLGSVSGTGFLVKNGAAWLLRTITGTAGDIVVTDGDGAAGNPVISSAATGVTAGTYGDGTNVPQITVNAVGKVTDIVEVPITGGGGGTPVVNVQISDMYTAITTSVIGGWVVPDNIELQDIWMGLRGDVSTSGDVEVGAELNGASILSQNPIIDVGDTNSLVNPTVISLPYALKGDILTFPVITAGTNATGLEAVITYILGIAPGYFGAVAALGPVFWWRHAEASGTTMVAQMGTDGTYSASMDLAQPALYPSGPTCMLAVSNRRGTYGGTIPALNALSIVCIVEFNAVTGFRGLLCNDNGANRKWQMRLNGTAFEFVKIVGGVATVAAAGAVTTATVYQLIVTVSVTGVVKLYRNGTLLTTSAALGAANYGGGGTIEIGYMSGGGGASANAYFSESNVYDYELTPTQVADLFTASGL